MTTLTQYFPSVSDVKMAHQNMKGVVINTPLMANLHLSETHGAIILLKREDLQVVRSYKIRGAYNKMSTLASMEKQRGIVCASAGNHAQGVAYTCHLLGIRGKIYMPATTPSQKVQQVQMFGKAQVEIVLVGDTFNDAYAEAIKECEEKQLTFIHPFNDPAIIEGQGTVGLELLEATANIDYVLVPVGGGGLAAGISSVLKTLSPTTRIIGVEPAGAAAMKTSIERGENTTLNTIDKFVDGAAVKRVGDYTFGICKELLDEVVTVPEGKICSTILQLYNKDAIVAEPAGALTIAALEQLQDRIKGKKIVCVLSGSNNDITRTEEIKERSLLYEGIKHYFIVRFPQRSGALREFLTKVLGSNDDITHFEYSKKNSREKGPAVVGIELQSPADFEPLLQRMQALNYFGEYLNDRPDLFQYLI